MTSAILMKKLLPATVAASALALTLSAPAQAAGFAGDYAPSNFTLSNTLTNGYVDLSAVPSMITLFGGDDTTQMFNFGQTRYVTTAAASGTVSFSWLYNTDDPGDPSTSLFSFYDRAGYIRNGVKTRLTVDTVGTGQSGTASFSVAAGDSFGFYVDTEDNGNGRGSIAISAFNAPTAEPIPTPAVLPGVLGLGLGLWRKRKVAADQTVA
jgi:hypothetical protein